MEKILEKKIKVILNMNEKKYQINWTKKAWKELAKLDRQVIKRIYQAVEKDLSWDPYSNGKRLEGDWKGFWSYRYRRSYRVIYEILESEVLIEIVEVGHRKEIYN